MDLLPAVLISYAQLGPVVQEQLTAAGVAPHHSRMEQRSQPPAVLVVGGTPKIQERLGREKRRQSDTYWLMLKGQWGGESWVTHTGQCQGWFCHDALERP